MNNTKIKVRNEIYTITESGNLVLSNPASITFFNAGVGGQNVVINNALTLSTQLDFLGGAAVNPYTFTMPMNSDEIDVTNYQVKFVTGAGLLYVIAKYYVNE